MTALVRLLEKLRIAREKLQIMQGDLTDSDQIQHALSIRQLCSALLGPPLAGASRLEAIRRTDVPRLVVVSMALLFPDVGLMGPGLPVFLRHHLRDSTATEKVVEASGLIGRSFGRHG